MKPKGVRRDHKDSDYSITVGSRKPKPKSDLNMSRLDMLRSLKEIDDGTIHG